MHRLDIIINRHGSSFNDMALYIFKILKSSSSCDPLIWFKYDDWQEGKNEIYWNEDYEGYFDSPYEHIVAPRRKPLKEQQILKYKDIHGELELVPFSSTDKSLRMMNCTESKRTAGLILKNPKDQPIKICTTTPEMNIVLEITPLPQFLLMWGPNTNREGTKDIKNVIGPACTLQLPDPLESKEPPSVTFSMEKSVWESPYSSPVSSGEIKKIVILPFGDPVSGA